MLRRCLSFYANPTAYDLNGGSQTVKFDGGQRAREVLEITDGEETKER